MSETSYFLNSQRGESQPERKTGWEDGSPETEDGPPVWLCKQCKKRIEGSYSPDGKLKKRPKCRDHGDDCYVGQSVKYYPKGSIFLLGDNTPFRDRAIVCSKECADLFDPDGKLHRMPQ